MKAIHLFFLLTVCLPCFVMCGMFDHESVGTKSVKDSASYSEEGKATVTMVFDVDYPNDGDPLMVRSVKQWMGGLLELTDTTAMAGPEQFAEAFFKQNEAGREMLKNYPEGYRYQIIVRKVDETPSYVSFVITTETTEGIKTTSTRTGATFVKPTGKVFGYEMFVDDKPRGMAVLVMKGLQEFFDADDFQELTAHVHTTCFSPMDQGVNTLPETAPWIEGNTVVFQYAQNELKGNSLYLPQARVPMSKAKKFFSQDFCRAIEEAKK